MNTETEPKQTAMQRLIENLNSRLEAGYELGYKPHSEGMSQIISIVELAKMLLPEERKVIEEAYEKGLHEVHGESDSIMSGEQYFETKFKQ